MSFPERNKLLRQVRHDLFDPEGFAQWILVTVLGAAIVIPLFFLLMQAFGETSLTEGIPTSFTLENLEMTLGQNQFQSALRNTILYVVGGIFIAHVYGFINAYILTKLDVPFSGVFHVLMFLPIFMSEVVMALGFNQAFLQGGIYNMLFEFVGLDAPNLRTVYGMIFVSSFYWMPFAYSFMASGIQNVDPELEEAAKIIGVGPVTLIRRITLPLIKPFILSSIFLTILLGFQSLATPLILGAPAREYVLSTYLLSLQTASFPPQYGMMAAAGFVMVVLSFVIAVSISRFIGDSNQYTTISGRGTSTSRHTPTWQKAIGVAWLCLYLTMGVFIPFAQVLSLGFLDGRDFTTSALTLDNFSVILESDLATTAIQNSVTIAVVTASASVLITGYIAYLKSHETNLRSRIISVLAWIPIATPGVVLALAYLWTFLYIQIGLYGTVFALILAFGVRFLALGTRMSESLILQQSQTLDEQGRVCGAGVLTRLRRIVFPNMKSGMISIWVILFTIYMNELSISIFLYTSESRVIAVTLVELFNQVQYNQLGALALIQLAITFSIVGLAMWYFDIDIRVA